MNRSTIVGRRVSSCVLAKVAIVKWNREINLFPLLLE